MSLGREQRYERWHQSRNEKNRTLHNVKIVCRHVKNWNLRRLSIVSFHTFLSFRSLAFSFTQSSLFMSCLILSRLVSPHPISFTFLYHFTKWCHSSCVDSVTLKLLWFQRCTDIAFSRVSDVEQDSTCHLNNWCRRLDFHEWIKFFTIDWVHFFFRPFSLKLFFWCTVAFTVLVPDCEQTSHHRRLAFRKIVQNLRKKFLSLFTFHYFLLFSFTKRSVGLTVCVQQLDQFHFFNFLLPWAHWNGKW